MFACALAVALMSAALQSLGAGESAFIDAVNTLQRARDGEDRMIAPAIAAFDALARAEPHQPVYLAYLGSAIALKGRESWAPWDKIEYTQRGLEKLDRALAALRPEHDSRTMRGISVGIETRLVAATVFLSVPDVIFHRRESARKLIAGMLSDPAFVRVPEDFRAQIRRLAQEVGLDVSR